MNFLKSLFSSFIKYECVQCAKNVPSKKALCFECNNNMGVINQNCICQKCGRYCLVETCYFCLTSPPIFTKARAACVYGLESSAVIKNFKYYNNSLCEKLISQKIAIVFNEHFLNEQIDIVLPVPMNGLKEYLKGCNHAEKLSQNLSRVTGIIMKADVLKRKFTIKRQAISSRKERFENIKNVFYIKNNFQVHGNNILLIDDAITTGATVNECAKVLLQNGANKVFVLTFAKSIKDENFAIA